MTKTEHLLGTSLYETDKAAPIVPDKLDNRLVQATNQSNILGYLSRFGWLTSRMVAELVWPNAAQSLTMARRTLSALTEEKLIFARRLSKGGAAYFLSAKGAGILRNEGIDAKSGYTISIGNPMHRACSNWYLIRAIVQGHSVFTEHEIASGKGPCKVLNGKVADGLVVVDGGRCIWVECEHSQKSRAERHKVVGLAKEALGRSELIELGPDLHLVRLAIVGTNQHALRWMAKSFEEARRYGGMTPAQLADIDACLLPISESLVPGEAMDANLYWDILHPDDNP